MSEDIGEERGQAAKAALTASQTCGHNVEIERRVYDLTVIYAGARGV